MHRPLQSPQAGGGTADHDGPPHLVTIAVTSVNLRQPGSSAIVREIQETGYGLRR
jgi:hypothetical protein